MNNDKLSLLALMHIPRDFSVDLQGRIQDFKLGGGGGGRALKKIGPSGGRREHFWGISYEKITILRKKIIFFPILGGARAGCAPPPPPGSAPGFRQLFTCYLFPRSGIWAIQPFGPFLIICFHLPVGRYLVKIVYPDFSNDCSIGS